MWLLSYLSRRSTTDSKTNETQMFIANTDRNTYNEYQVCHMSLTPPQADNHFHSRVTFNDIIDMKPLYLHRDIDD